MNNQPPHISLFNRVSITIFLLGLALCLTVFAQPHHEGDELIYQTLVQQLSNGHGYTLHDSDIVNKKLVDPSIYDKPIFFHPPGGIAFFWLLTAIFAGFGFSVAQVFAYSLFYWSMLFLSYRLQRSYPLSTWVVASLSAFTPLMTHVTTKYWLDGPLLAFTTLSTALFVWAIQKKNLPLSIGAGIVLGFASLIKITAFFVLPSILLLAWVLTNNYSIRDIIKFGSAFLIPAILIQLPWEIWQWVELGTPMTTAAGCPPQSLIDSNPYIRYVTVTRTPWAYINILPKILWTLIPSVFMLFVVPKTNQLRIISIVWFFWIASIIIIQTFLGFLGYSKVMRYAILLTPAAIMLFTMLFSDTIQQLKASDRTPTLRTITLTLLLLTATFSFVLEVATGICASCLYQNDLIIPFGGF